MGNAITSKNSWELLLSSIAGAFDGADTFILGTFDEAENYAYKTVITNHRTNEEISKYITAIKLNVPDSGDKISSIKATFDLEDLIVQNDDYVTIKILNSTESAEITVLKGKVKILKRDINMMNLSHYSVEIVDEFNKLFEKTVTDDIFLFDKYIYSEQYKENSILYIIAKKLGFTNEQMSFEDVRDSQSRLVKIPFILFRKNNRYIDELQTLLDVTKGRMYIDNMEQIVFENGLFEYEKAIIYPFDIRNILKNVGIDYKYTDKNGVRVIYDSYKNLANQVIFDLANKVEVAPGTTSATAKELGIKFITDLATQHNITKAEGYYYENEQQIRVSLLLNTHYEVIEFSETSAKVKFLNPYASKFYIDKFEIKGIPLAMFSDNEVSVKATKDMQANQENFSSYNKNKYIQTEELASDIARVEYLRNCKNKKEYSFKSNFVPHLEPGDVCTLKINDIDTLIQISTIEHTLSRVNGFYSEIVALEYEKIEQEFNYSKIESLTAVDSFLGTLNNIKDQVDETDKKLEEVILIEGARGYVDENDPRDSGKPVAEPDVWFNPITKEFKVWRNGRWNPAREEDIPPALMTALKAQAGIFRIGGNDTEAGIFFQYDKDTMNPVFGSTDSENLAQVSIDRKANVLIRNANNKLAFNMRDPENPTKVISQFIMGVYNANDGERHKDTLFQVGDESTGTYIKFTRGNIGTIAYDGKEVKQHINESKADALEALDKLDKIASDGWLTASEKTTLEKEWEEIKQEFPKVRDRGTTYKVNVQAYADSKNALDAYLLPMLNAENFFIDTQINRIEFNSKFTNYYDARTNIFVAIEEKVKESAINGAKGYADEVIAALGNDLNNQIDGKINTYNQETDPSSGWTADEKIKNTGDLWYKPTEKITKRWTGATWQNLDAKDTVAQALASSKRRVFTAQPFTPYDAGDLWITDTSSTGDMMVCVTSRVSGNYAANEWKKATKYTDDTKANEAAKKAESAKLSADGVQGQVNEMSSDNKLSPIEKQQAKKEWDIIVAEYPQNLSKATAYGVATTTYTNAYNTLNTYITPLLSNLGTTSDIAGTTFRANFKNYYDAEIKLTGTIYDKVKESAVDDSKKYADTIDTKVTGYMADGVLTPAEKGDLRYEIMAIENRSTTIKSRASVFGVSTTTLAGYVTILTNWKNGVLSQAGIYNNLTQVNTLRVDFRNYYTEEEKVYDGIDKKAKALADKAQTDANGALGLLTDIASDNKLTASEKQTTKKEWDAIISEYAKNVDQAKIYGVSYTDYTNKYNTLNTYITPLLSNLGTTSNIVGTTFRANFKNYYDSRLVLLNAITAKIKTLADNAQNTGDSAINNQNNGHLTINANTIFKGDASFISRGSNETTIITAGSISFTRDGQTITTIRNMKSGSIATDGNGSGYVDFTGMKSGLLIIPSIQSFNVSSNVRSLNCRAERDPNYTAQNRYKFFVYGTQENQDDVLFETSTKNTWGQTAYTVGVEGSTVSTSGSVSKVANAKSEEVRNLSYRVTELPVIHQDVYIQGAYFGRVSYTMPSPSVRASGGSVVVAVPTSSIWNGYSGMSKSTQSKDWKDVKVTTTVTGSYRVSASGEYKYTVWDTDSGAQVYWAAFAIPIDLTPTVSFASMKCYHIPTSIQNIVGGGTVSYLAIEQ